MSLLNRPERYNVLYDSEGRLVDGWHSADALAAALSATIQDEDAGSECRTPANDSTSAQASSEPLDGPRSESGRSSSSVPNSLGSGSEEQEFHDPSAGASQRNSNSEDGEDPFADSVTTEGNDNHTPTTSRRFEWSLGVPDLNPPLLPGQLLKAKFIEHGIIGTMLVSSTFHLLRPSFPDSFHYLSGPLLQFPFEQFPPQRRLRYPPTDLSRCSGAAPRSSTCPFYFLGRPSH